MNAPATTPGASARTFDEDAENPLHRLTPEQIEQLGKEFDALHDEVKDDLGERDAKYIRGVIGLHRRLVLLARLELFFSRWRIPWAVGTATLGAAKILENMEIGHNVLHGQWDWMNDPVINSAAWDWDTASTSEAWKHSHNYVHHTYTNIRGKDRDLGYEIMRIDPHQKWHPVYLLQPFYNLLLMAGFEWGVAAHDLDFDAIRAGEKDMKELRRQLVGMGGKARDQVVKDYIAFPLLSGLLGVGFDAALAAAGVQRAPEPEGRVGRLALRARRRLPRRQRTSQTVLSELVALRSFRTPFRNTLRANLIANIIRNVWSHSIIFCGHFPDQTYTFSVEETEDESRGARYVRQLLGAANIEGSPFFHVMSGNLGYQVEHHLYPDMPSTRYGEIAPRVREICERYELPYNTGPFGRQLGSVHRTIARLAFPGGKPRPKPGPYRGEPVKNSGEEAGAGSSSGTANGSGAG